MFKSFIQSIFLTILGFFNVAVAAEPEPNIHLSVATWNVQNLFDWLDDPTTNDDTYQALTNKSSITFRTRCNKIRSTKYRTECLEMDWSRDVVMLKVKRIAQILASARPKLDVIALQEIENFYVLQLLVDQIKTISGIEYQIVHINDRDRRGIDSAFLTTLKIVSTPVLQHVSNVKRGLLQVMLENAYGHVIKVITSHFPAPYNPWLQREKIWRELVKNLLSSQDADLTIALGDFNTVPDEFNSLLNWPEVKNLDFVHQKCSCAGTFYYKPKREWSFLDMIILGTGQEGWSYTTSDIGLLVKTENQIGAKGSPNAFYGLHAERATGVSDHFPLTLTLQVDNM